MVTDSETDSGIAPAPPAARSSRRVELPDYLPARMINEYVYCPRLFFYEWVEGVFAHSADTVEGALRHEKLERKEDPLPPPREREATDEVPVIHSRSVTLSSETYRLIAVIDLVEGDATHVVPVDYKRGSPRDAGEGPQAWPADRAQLCAQALILRDNGYACDEAVAYYHTTRQRVGFAIDDALVGDTLRAVEQARSLAAEGVIPSPLVDSPKCPRCSLVTICLPDETGASHAAAQPSGPDVESTVAGAATSAGRAGTSGAPREVRRLVPARDDLRPLYVTGHGLSVGKSGDVLQVRDRKQLIQEARLHDTSQVNLFGNVQISAAAIQGLCESDKPLCHFSYGGWFYGLTHGLGLKNIFLRRDQFRRADDGAFCLLVSRDIVATKIRNQRTLLQRNHVDPPGGILSRLKALAQQALGAERLDELLGIEGTAARLYFEHFAGMIKTNAGEPGSEAFDFTQRNRRPPRDPVNALLSLAYSLLARDLTIVCHAVGFDPFIGFYHQPRFGRPALALDLMEGFRPIVGDSCVLTAINTGMVTAEDFIRVGPAVSLKPTGRKGFIRAYEQRMDTLVTHPVFGYRVSYRRVFEIQTRMLGRFVTGEIDGYPGFETR